MRSAPFLLPIYIISSGLVPTSLTSTPSYSKYLTPTQLNDIDPPQDTQQIRVLQGPIVLHSYGIRATAGRIFPISFPTWTLTPKKREIQTFLVVVDDSREKSHLWINGSDCDEPEATVDLDAYQTDLSSCTHNYNRVEAIREAYPCKEATGPPVRQSVNVFPFTESHPPIYQFEKEEEDDLGSNSFVERPTTYEGSISNALKSEGNQLMEETRYRIEYGLLKKLFCSITIDRPKVPETTIFGGNSLVPYLRRLAVKLYDRDDRSEEEIPGYENPEATSAMPNRLLINLKGTIIASYELRYPPFPPIPEEFQQNLSIEALEGSNTECSSNYLVRVS